MEISKPSSTPVARVSVWPTIGRPARFASAMWSRIRRQPSGLRSTCRIVIASGRRLRSTTRRSMANSASRSSKSEITCSQPAPTSPIAAPMAVSSSSAAVRVGIGRPSRVLWLRVREVEKPKAPARTPAAASSAMAALSSAVAGSRFTPRSPMTKTRTGECGTCAAISRS